jgi:imidazolonepropionase-like amidohydrolase
MMKPILTILTALFILSAPAMAAARDTVIKNTTIMPVSAPAIEHGSLLIRDGKIAAMGQTIEIPAGAEVVDGSGLFLYPGIIDAFSQYGLGEIGAVSSSNDSAEMGRENPELKVSWVINPHSVHIGVGRVNGTTTALVAPGGNVIPGQAALIKMTGWTVDEMVFKDDAVMLINFPVSPRYRGEGGGGQQTETKMDVTAKLVEKIKDYLKAAREYHRLKELAGKDPTVAMPVMNLKFEAMAPVLQGITPVIITVEKAKDIEHAIRFAKEEKLRVIFRGCSQGYQVADKIKSAGIPVIIDSLYQGPTEPEEGYDAPFLNAGVLSKAGVTLCFSSGTDASSGKDITYHAARSVAYGLDHEAAIRSLTLDAARVLGIDKRVGSIEVGKDADFFLTTGDPLDIRSEVRALFIDGRRIDPDNWWEQQYRKWEARPK